MLAGQRWSRVWLKVELELEPELEWWLRLLLRQMVQVLSLLKLALLEVPPKLEKKVVPD